MTTEQVIDLYQRLHDILSEAIENPTTNYHIAEALGDEYSEVVQILEAVAGYRRDEA